jgi:hypothetical protein
MDYLYDAILQYELIKIGIKTPDWLCNDCFICYAYFFWPFQPASQAMEMTKPKSNTALI